MLLVLGEFLDSHQKLGQLTFIASRDSTNGQAKIFN